MPTPHRTKIVATIGPASCGAAQIDALLDAGMNVARVNCAHGTHDSLRDMVATLRHRAGEKGVPLAVLADLAGPKLRVGRFAGGGVDLVQGASFTLTTEEVVGDARLVSVNHDGLPADVTVGDAVFLNDGLLRLEVKGIHGREIDTTVQVGGWLADLKGLSVPSAEISTPSLTEKDRRDLDFLAGCGVDYIGLSFVRSEDDISLLRRELARRGMSLPIVAKIEKKQAVDRLDAIVQAADAVMVARGDLGVECPIEEGPMLQKKIIRVCNRAAKPVITATQMLESMVDSPRPTRAEASDVANAVLDGSDAVMLSAETATGRYPVDAVRMMRTIILSSESSQSGSRRDLEAEPPATLTLGEAVGRSACLAAESIGAGAIVSLTGSGATARFLARWRPRQPLFGVTSVPETWRRLNLIWGIRPILCEPFSDRFTDQCERVVSLLREQDVEAGTAVVITAGLPFSERGRTNTIRIETL